MQKSRIFCHFWDEAGNDDVFNCGIKELHEVENARIKHQEGINLLNLFVVWDNSLIWHEFKIEI